MKRHEMTRLGTCCYCGARTLLELTARGGHELACGSCGAPIHHMKGLRAETPAKVKPTPPAARPAAQSGGAASLAAAGLALIGSARAARSDPKRRKKKSIAKRKVSRVFEAFEDVFDDVFDIFD